MHRQLSHLNAQPRAALTLTDFIVTVLTVMLVMSFLLPSVNRSSRVSRRLECANNLKQLALAASASASANNGKVPLLSEPGPGMASDIRVGWQIHLFPYMDQNGAIEYVQAQETNQKAKLALTYVLANNFKNLQCPMHSKQFNQPGGISFGATDHSTAAIDWNHNGKLDSTDQEVARATGVFWFADDHSSRLTYDDIINGDGSGTTILFAESMNLTPMHQAGAKGNGENPRALDLGIGIGYDSLRLAKAAKPSLLLDRGLKASADYDAYFKPNSNQGQASGKWPAVSSMHPGGVNVVFADGHVQFVSDQVHWAVWASLHTPLGTQYGQAPVSEGEF